MYEIQNFSCEELTSLKLFTSVSSSHMLKSCLDRAAEQSEQPKVAKGPPDPLGRVSRTVAQGVHHPTRHPDPASRRGELGH